MMIKDFNEEQMDNLNNDVSTFEINVLIELIIDTLKGELNNG